MFKIFYFHISLWMIVMFSLDAHTLVLLPLCNKLKLYNLMHHQRCVHVFMFPLIFTCASFGLVKANRATQAQVHSSAQLPVQFHFSIHASVWEPFLRSPFSPLWDWFPRASQSIRGADHFTGWKRMWSVSRWHRWEWIDFVTCMSHTLPTQYADYTLSSWQLHGALCGTVVGNMLNKKYFFFGPWKMFSTGHILCASVLCVVICGGALLQMFQETFTSEWFWKTSAKRLRHQPTTQRSSRALKTPGSF